MITTTLPRTPSAPPRTPSTLPVVLRAAVEARTGVALRQLGEGGAVDTSYAELARAAGELARGLASLRIHPGERVAILSATRAEWTLGDVAALLAGAVVVPVDPAGSAHQIWHVLAHSGARAVLCEDAARLAQVDAVAARLPQLEHRVLLTGRGPSAMTLAELRARGRALDPLLLASRGAAVAPGDTATIVYEPDGTSTPKGCMLSHANLLASAAMYRDRLGLGGSGSTYMFLPLAHVHARVAQLIALTSGGTIVFWRRDVARIADELAEVAPTHVALPPRLLEAICARAEAAGRGGPARRTVARWAISEGARQRARERAGADAGALARRRLAVADRLVLARVRAAFGPNLQFALTDASVAPQAVELLDACGVLVLEGYGPAETTAAATVNTVGEHRHGTIGRPLPGTEVAVADDGELLVRGPHVFKGYHRDPVATARRLRHGWLTTGARGTIDADGVVRIVAAR